MWQFESMQRYGFAQIFCNQKHILDAGCKYGYGTKYLSMVAKDVIGIDISSSRLNDAERDNNADNIEYLRIDLESQELFEKFDVIVCLETIEHLEYPKNWIAHVPKLLEKGGLFIFSVPWGDRLHEDGSRIEEHLQVFETEKDVKNLIEPYLDIQFLGRQYPMSFIGIAHAKKED